MNSIRKKTFKVYYTEIWLPQHPGSLPYQQLVNYVMQGGEYGRKMSAELLASLCGTSRNTMGKWIAIIRDENKQ